MASMFGFKFTFKFMVKTKTEKKFIAFMEKKLAKAPRFYKFLYKANISKLLKLFLMKKLK